MREGLLPAMVRMRKVFSDGIARLDMMLTLPCIVRARCACLSQLPTVLPNVQTEAFSRALECALMLQHSTVRPP